MGPPSTSDEQGGRCRRHPRHRQATGVCPYCLRECLSHLSHHHYPSATAYLSSSSPCSSSSDSDVSSSEDSSPLHLHGLGGGKEKGEIKKTRKKEKGWWKVMSGSKRSWTNKEEGRGGANLMHSQTFKEKHSAKWVLFA
ncbi:uncharacterized protein LOC122030395 [Zingiber officinale]|uniref:uncharacterized protein LOC122030395 n=1 Tax=Zingiber officinale TaxID=94328 RepID=UPI001C4A7E67|nr:uncharacterized protein LOC122030395 [Zingiber officinale]